MIKNFKAQQRYLKLGIRELTDENEISRNFSVPETSPNPYRTLNDTYKSHNEKHTPNKKANHTIDHVELGNSSDCGDQKGRVNRILPSLRKFDKSFYSKSVNKDKKPIDNTIFTNAKYFHRGDINSNEV